MLHEKTMLKKGLNIFISMLLLSCLFAGIAGFSQQSTNILQLMRTFPPQWELLYFLSGNTLFTPFTFAFVPVFLNENHTLDQKN
jgi:hypothetical protein